MLPTLTPNMAPNLTKVMPPCAYRRLASFTRSAVSFATAERSPFGPTFLALPLTMQSVMFCKTDPANKCAGLTHAGVSHLWQICKPAGMEPKAHSYDSRCAYRTFPSQRIWPYPALLLAAVHSQQPADLSTRCQNRLAKMSLKPISYLVLVLLEIDRQRRNGRSFAPQTIAQGGVSAMGNEIVVTPLANDASPLVSVNRTNAVSRTE